MLPKNVVGGIPQRDAGDILSRVVADLDAALEHDHMLDDDPYGASIDLSKCFDREVFDFAVEACKALGLDEKRICFILKFYAMNVTRFL